MDSTEETEQERKHQKKLANQARWRATHRKQDCDRTRKWQIEHREQRNEYTKRYRARHPGQRKEYFKKYRAEHSEQLKKYRAEHREQAYERTKKWVAEHSEQARENQKKYAAEHPERLKEYVKKYRAKHLGQHEEYVKKWKVEHPELVRQWTAARRARKANAPVIENIDRAYIFKRDKGKCHICKKKVDPKNWHLDHLTPLSRGGEHSHRNVAVTHPSCNLRKHVGYLPSQLRAFG